ncbi:S-layer homology domain-containing protein [Pseudoneobacillus sp. C159]
MKQKFLLLIVTLLAIGSTACSKLEADANMVTEAAGVDWTESEVAKVTTKVGGLETRTALLEKEIQALLAGQPSASKEVFKDVTKEYWAFPEIMSLYYRNLISGYVELQQFKPENSITRAQAAAMLVKALKLPVSETPSIYTDVKDDLATRKAIMTVTEKGYFKGSGGKFMPNAPMTRKHMAVVLQRAFALKTTAAAYQDYSDVAKTNDGYDSIKAVTQNGIATGSGGKFSPADPTKRSQFSVFLYRALNTK